MRAKRRTERVNVRLPVEVARWVRRRAAEKGSTISSVVAECVERAYELEKAEVFARAAVKLLSALLAMTGRGPGQVAEQAKTWEDWALGLALREALKKEGSEEGGGGE
ncbi:CopG family transcriptional regulator [Desulfothermobacter acidiphilus]|uniref:CopG family transcriptional regulator n=1 Tax=Desulfothermobacter acidiphilus TaxID=1938353 RepID=UPI003F88F520